MSKTRDNHYVPQWYQRGFLSSASNKLHCLDLTPNTKQLPDGRVITMNEYHLWPTSKCFFERDLYTTFFGKYINDEIEKKLFGGMDDTGSKAVRAFIGKDISEWHNNFSNFFSYIDSQKIRTPKGLDWIKNHYPELGQIDLMCEMQAIRNLHCTIWTEGVREIVSAEKSELKFIISDHPVTIYNHACPPKNKQCVYPNDPPIAFKGTQTIFPLDMNHCLILTNYEYAKNPDTEDPIEKRTYSRNFRNSLVRTDTFVRSRSLDEEDVVKINLIIKTRARKYIAASEKDWLYPERNTKLDWQELREVLLPPENELWHYGGETYVGYEDGSTSYQDVFGRTTPENKYLKKPKRKDDPRPNDRCGCGSGKKYKKCCMNKKEAERPSWEELSIRERNIIFYNGITDILGLSINKTWDDVRKELSNEQVKKIHELYGFLWPLETDIVRLLPKPDKSLRALYTGIMDPRVISGFAISLTLYFDEIIIQSPFINPNALKPEFSPVHSPHQHKQQVLKNILLFLTLMPFIEEGYINFIPDPCAFDMHLREQMFNMAQGRSKEHQINKKDLTFMEQLHIDDFKRATYMLPKTQLKAQINRVMPDLSENQIEEHLKYMDTKKLQDPLTLLQDNVYSDEGGQLTIMNLSPNFEISLFISQVTGALLLTDSNYRWKEMLGSQNEEGGKVVHNWSELASCINDFEYILNPKPEIVFQLRTSGKLGKLRKAMREIYSAIQENSEPEKIKFLTEKLKPQVIGACKLARKEINDLSEYSFNSKFCCIIPKGGIVHNNVQRMLLSCGIDNYLRSVPMAIFVERA